MMMTMKMVFNRNRKRVFFFQHEANKQTEKNCIKKLFIVVVYCDFISIIRGRELFVHNAVIVVHVLSLKRRVSLRVSIRDN